MAGPGQTLWASFIFKCFKLLTILQYCNRIFSEINNINEVYY